MFLNLKNKIPLKHQIRNDLKAYTASKTSTKDV